MTDATPAWTHFSKWRRYISLNVRSSTFTSTKNLASSMLLHAKCFAHAMTCFCTPFIIATAMAPRWQGSSPYVSCDLPHPGCLGTLMQTPPSVSYTHLRAHE